MAPAIATTLKPKFAAIWPVTLPASSKVLLISNLTPFSASAATTAALAWRVTSDAANPVLIIVEANLP